MNEMSERYLKLDAFCVLDSASAIEALKKIDLNKKGFLIVLDGEEKVLGTLTDGDIRRTILDGSSSLNQPLRLQGVFNRNFTYLTIKQSIEDAIEIFRIASFDFLPILRTDMTLSSVLTKKQLYTMLLQCQNPLMHEDFTAIDETLMDFEMFNRPWGLYKTTVLQDSYQSKVLQIKPGASLSLQYHLHREEYWTVAYGDGIVHVGESEILVHPGSMVFIPRGCKHRLVNTSDSEYLVVSEVQIGDYFGEDDIVRIEDRYGRVPPEGEGAE